MAKFAQLLAAAVAETFAMLAAPTAVWVAEGRPFGPSIPAGDSVGSYRSSQAAMAALAQLADGVLANDPELRRAVSDDAARLEASRTLGELLPELGTDEAADWTKFRARLLERLRRRAMRLTHYLPVWIFDPNGVPAFAVGPVRFIARDDWLKEIETRRGARSSWMAGVEDAWSGRIALDTGGDPNVVSVARSVGPKQWVAVVTVDGFEPDESYRRALAATRAALDALRLVVPAPQNARVCAARDHGPPIKVDRLSQADGQDLAHGSALHLRGLRGGSAEAVALIGDHASLFAAAGARIALYLRPAPTVAAGCPQLSDRWVNALHWYGLGCAAEADFQALVNFVVALDVLSDGGEETGIRRLAARLFGAPEDSPVLADGTTLRAFVKRLYGYRSRIAHGSVLGLDERLRQDRAWAEWLAAMMLHIYVLELERHAAAGAADDRKAFFAALPPPAPAASPAPAGPTGAGP